MNTLKPIIAGTFAAVSACGIAAAQGLPEGRIYAFHSQAQHNCPAMDWHLVVGANGTLTGMISWNNMQSVARASGTVDSHSQTFQLAATEEGGRQRTATIKGTVTQDGWLDADIQGADVNCHSIKVPWYVPYRG
jgi:hypothetical protein